MTKLKKTGDVIARLAALYLLWRGFVELGNAADQHNPYRFLLGIVYIIVGCIGTWIAYDANGGNHEQTH